MAKLDTLDCQHCRGVMKKTTAGRGFFRQLLAVTFFFVGVAVCFVQLFVGIGIVLLVLILDRPGKKVWKCQRCGAIIERD